MVTRLLLILLISVSALRSLAEDLQQLSLRGDVATASFSTNGGGLVEFRLNENSINPLNWEVSQDVKEKSSAANDPKPQGHFLCLDRWGAPSVAEAAKGIPFHGEASHVEWQIKRPAAVREGRIDAVMACELPLAGMQVERHVSLETTSSVLVVTEKVTNIGRMGRLYNMVQHPSIAPPFLDDSTIVDSNAQQGFSQQGPIPDSRQSANNWPQMKFDSELADLRRFEGGRVDGSDVSSFVFADEARYGWVTAGNPGLKLLLGYIWQTEDYPWLNIWRFRQKNQVAARGLEFGTTGYHQPFPILVKQHQILDRRLYEYLDLDETHQRSFLAFVSPIPDDFAGVANVSLADGKILISDKQATVIQVPISSVPWKP